METSLINESTLHTDFKTLAQKSIGSSLSMPVLESRHKNLVGEEKFKVTIDKKVTELYYQLLQNRVNKLKREENLERKKLESLEKLEKYKADIFERKRQDQEFSMSNKQYKLKGIEKTKESIQQMKTYHSQLMHEIKSQSKGLCQQLNSERKVQKLKHLRIKSEILEVSRLQNLKKASKIRESEKTLEKVKEKNWVVFKAELKSKYQNRIDQEKQEKAEFEKKMKALEVEEQALLQKLGRSQLSSTTFNQS